MSIAKKLEKSSYSKWIKLGMMFLLAIVVILFASNSFTKEIVFRECGTQLPNYQYSLRFPFYWRAKQTTLDISSSYYELRGTDSVFTVSCTNQGVGGDICDDKHRTKFMVDGKNYEACFGKVNGKWNMGVLNLSTDPITNATIAFWSEGLKKSQIEKILSSVKIYRN
jgi:hypothetical protein